jgi:hypothetical protein
LYRKGMEQGGTKGIEERKKKREQEHGVVGPEKD